MKLTKKAAALLLAASLAVSVCATPVFAENTTPPINNGQHVQDATGENVDTVTTQKQACTQLKYNVTEGYTWSIPADINFGGDNGVTNANKTERGKVTVNNCKIKDTYTLKITIAGNGGRYGMGTSSEFMVKTAEGAELPYEVNVKKNGAATATPVMTGSEVLELAAGNNHAESELTFTLKTQTTDTDAAEKAGEYIGYAIFTAQATNT